MSNDIEKKIACDDCGEAGRVKAILPIDVEEVADLTSYSYFCHDEEKSCYNFYIMRMEYRKLLNRGRRVG